MLVLLIPLNPGLWLIFLFTYLLGDRWGWNVTYQSIKLAHRLQITQCFNHQSPHQSPVPQPRPPLSKLLTPFPLPAPSLAHISQPLLQAAAWIAFPGTLLSSWSLLFFPMTRPAKMYLWHLNAKIVLICFWITALAVYRYIMRFFKINIWTYYRIIWSMSKNTMFRDQTFSISSRKTSAFPAKEVSEVDRWHPFWLHALSMVGSFFSFSVKSPSELSAPSSVLLGCPSLAVPPFPLQCSADLLACLPFVPWHLQPILQSTFTT